MVLPAIIAACEWNLTSPTPFSRSGHRDAAVLVGAGDIAVCGSAGTEATARLLDGLSGSVFTAGDNAYPSGTTEQLRDCYDPTWGRHKARTRPSPGNHDYEAAGAAPYFEYFGINAGPPGAGYYRYRLGEWQVYSLNSNMSMAAGSPQLQWLERELSANSSTCTLAYWHHPLFSSGPNGENPFTRSVWRVLYDFDADVVIAAHEHYYERFAPQDPDGRRDSARGIRQFIVGTGGANLTFPLRLLPNSEMHWSNHGVLQLALGADSYQWVFYTASGAAADAGSSMCHRSIPN